MEIGDNFEYPDAKGVIRKYNIKKINKIENRVDAAAFKTNPKGEERPQKGRPSKFNYTEILALFAKMNRPVQAPEPQLAVAKPCSAKCDDESVSNDVEEDWENLRASREAVEAQIKSCTIMDKSTTDDW